MENMELYNAVRAVPDSAKKQIDGGRLKGMTDINPMWRIQTLTERFGPCGYGWKYVIREKSLERGENGEVSAFVDIDLFYRMPGEDWSEAVPGTGGAGFLTKERSGMYMSDECFKMALTDALSVACKAMGVGADVYWEKGRTKYEAPPGQKPEGEPMRDGTTAQNKCADCGKPITDGKKRDGSPWSAADIIKYSSRMFGWAMCPDCQRKAYERAKNDRPSA